jgi:ferric-dicitrate binding protein FerR (iron transport regulator)
VKEFVNRISTRDPEGAAGWAMSIVDPDTKEQAVKKALSAWERVDPEKAKIWQKTNAPEIK